MKVNSDDRPNRNVCCGLGEGKREMPANGRHAIRKVIAEDALGRIVERDAYPEKTGRRHFFVRRVPER